ncbi:MAG: head GIN domain-containing protein [Sphingosinicella sp.]
MTRLLFMIAGLFTVAAPAAAAERRFAVTDFDRVVVEGPYVVRLVTGRPSAATATGPRAAVDRLSLDVTGQTLRIRRNRNQWVGATGVQGPVTIELATRTLRGARLIGPSELTIDRVAGLRVDLSVEGSGRMNVAGIAADNLTFGLFGSGRLELAGRSGTVRADIQGSGDVVAPQLRAETLTITSTTSGNVTLTAVRSATVNALGLGTISVAGRSACTVRGPGADLVRCGQPSR